MQYVVLLRGVNVGGHNKVPMKVLSAALEEASCTGVVTYIQSGNIVLNSELNNDALLTLIGDTIERTFGFRVSVLVQTAAEWHSIFSSNPFANHCDNEQYLKVLNTTFLKNR